jgi:hypothetical protein
VEGVRCCQPHSFEPRLKEVHICKSVNDSGGYRMLGTQQNLFHPYFYIAFLIDGAAAWPIRRFKLFVFMRFLL